MNTPVHDDLVLEYIRRLKAGGPLGEVFSRPVGECGFTEKQREMITKARADKRSLQKKLAKPVTTSPNPCPKPNPVAPAKMAEMPAPKIAPKISKMQKLLFLQLGRCFFCGELLHEQHASIEHLNPKSRGGTNSPDNLVVCHKSLNETFGAMELKRKFEFILKAAGCFQCPK